MRPGRLDNRMAAQHFPRDLVRPRSGLKNWLKRRIRTRNEYPVISDLAIHKLWTTYLCEALWTTYLCEEAFSKLIIIKSKNRSFLKNVKNVLCPPLSFINLQLRIDDLCKNHQVHPPHYLC